MYICGEITKSNYAVILLCGTWQLRQRIIKGESSAGRKGKVRKAFSRCYVNALFMICSAPLYGGHIDFWPWFAVDRDCAFCVGGSQLAECDHPQLDV